MKIKDLPLEIQELVKQRVFEEDGNYNDFKPESTINMVMSWGETPEGHAFWSEIDSGNIEYFYNLYPKKVKAKAKLNSPIYSNGKSIYYGSIKDKKVKITIEYINEE